MARILYLGLWAKDKSWNSEKEAVERNIKGIGKNNHMNIGGGHQWLF